MDSQRLLRCLADDYERLHEVVDGADLTATVPSCPEWTVEDLARHVGMVYWHKVECMRRNASPEPWPPEGNEKEPTLALLERAYGELVAELTTRPPEMPAYTWYEPDQTVGFWTRRMAQETVIHRVDAELATGSSIAPIPDDLAVDGIDEYVVAFLAYGSKAWPDYFADVLADADGRAVRIEVPGSAWSVRLTPAQIEVGPAEVGQAEVGQADDGGSATATVTGDPAAVQLWLWNRGGDETVTLAGDPSVLAHLHRVLTTAGS